MLSVESTNTKFIVFGLTRPGLKPTIYRTRGEHSNHYATDAVLLIEYTLSQYDSSTDTRFIYIFVYYLRLSIKKGPYRFRVGSLTSRSKTLLYNFFSELMLFSALNMIIFLQHGVRHAYLGCQLSTSELII